MKLRIRLGHGDRAGHSHRPLHPEPCAAPRPCIGRFDRFVDDQPAAGILCTGRDARAHPIMRSPSDDLTERIDHGRTALGIGWTFENMGLIGAYLGKAGAS